MKFLSVSKIHFLSLLKIKTLETIKDSSLRSERRLHRGWEAKGGICL